MTNQSSVTCCPVPFRYTRRDELLIWGERSYPAPFILPMSYVGHRRP